MKSYGSFTDFKWRFRFQRDIPFTHLVKGSLRKLSPDLWVCWGLIPILCKIALNKYRRDVPWVGILGSTSANKAHPHKEMV